jgi:hypothetical protein
MAIGRTHIIWFTTVDERRRHESTSAGDMTSPDEAGRTRVVEANGDVLHVKRGATDDRLNMATPSARRMAAGRRNFSAAQRTPRQPRNACFIGVPRKTESFREAVSGFNSRGLHADPEPLSLVFRWEPSLVVDATYRRLQSASVRTTNKTGLHFLVTAHCSASIGQAFHTMNSRSRLAARGQTWPVGLPIPMRRLQSTLQRSH